MLNPEKFRSIYVVTQGLPKGLLSSKLLLLLYFKYIAHFRDVRDLDARVVAQVFAQLGNEHVEATANEIIVDAPL
jgi:hypothetical protein